MEAIVLFAACFLFIIIGIPLAFALFAGMIVCILVSGKIDLIIFPLKMLEGVDVFILLAIPLFILAGTLMDIGGIAFRIMKFAQSLVGHLRGGLPMAVIVSEMFFSGISGSTLADGAAIGSMDIPALKKAGYEAEYAVSIVSASSAMGILIPPCNLMIILGSMMNVSVAMLFMAGFLPAFLLASTLFILVYIQARIYNFPRDTRRLSVRKIWDALLGSSAALVMVLIIFGGILGGIMTPTEAGAIAVIYGAIVGIIIYREISPRRLWQGCLNAALSSASVLFLLAIANNFIFILGVHHIPDLVSKHLLEIIKSPFVLLTLSSVLLILLGATIEPVPALLLFLPFLLPITDGLSVDRIQFGIIITAALGIGQFIPPIGIGFILVASIGRVEVNKCFKYLGAFMGILFIGLLFLIMFPDIISLVPSYLSNR